MPGHLVFANDRAKTLQAVTQIDGLISEVCGCVWLCVSVWCVCGCDCMCGCVFVWCLCAYVCVCVSVSCIRLFVFVNDRAKTMEAVNQMDKLISEVCFCVV